MNTPLVSVIIPIYNVESYLVQCIDSVLAQTYRNLEIILVDDGSPDKSPEICDKYAVKDSRIKVIHKINEGLSSARNDGIDVSKGKYLFFLDADDYLASECIEKLVEASQNGALPISGYILDFSDEDKLIEVQQAYGEYSNIKDYFNDFYKMFATKFNFVWGKLYKTDIIKNNGLKFRQGISLGEDVLFNIDYYRFCNKGVIAVPYNGYYYRQHGNETLSKKFNPKMFEWNETCYTAIREYLKEFGCFNSENRDHLYRNIAGNYQYGFSLIANNTNMGFKNKVSLIRKYKETPIYLDSLSAKHHRRIDYRILQNLLHQNMIRSYIVIENLKRIFVHGNF